MEVKKLEQLEIASAKPALALVVEGPVSDKTMALVKETKASVAQDKRDIAKVIAGLKKAAVDAITSAEKAFQKYWDLMVYIRDNEIPPEVVVEQLKAAGFAESRISEVKRVAGASEDIFQQFRKRAIGFKLALQMSRDEDKKKKEPQKRSSDQDNFAKAIRHAVEDTIPLSGKFPAWAKKVTLDAHGCDVVVYIKRKDNGGMRRLASKVGQNLGL